MTATDDSCPVCASSHLTLLLELGDTDGRTDQRFKVLECPTCQIALTSPLLQPEELGPYYENAYYAKTKGGLISKCLDWVEEIFYQNRIQHVLAFRQHGRLLDIGCGHGRFVSTAINKGFQAEGLEFSSSGQKLSQDRDVLIHRGTLLSVNLDAESYDIITCWHSFEHFPDPVLHLSLIKRLLKPGGLLLLALPNYKSWEAGRGHQLGHWLHLDVPRHQYHYSPAGTDRLLHKAGFTSQHVTASCFEHNFAGMLVTLQNRWGAAKNIFYDHVKRGHIFHKPQSAHSWLRCMAVIGLSFALSPALLFWNWKLEKQARAGTYITFAEIGRAGEESELS